MPKLRRNTMLRIEENQTMRKVIFSIQVTLDGFIEGSNGDLAWMIMDDELWAEVNELLQTVDTVLFGRVAYQGFAAYWPAAGTNPLSPPAEVAFARWIEKTPKVVFSTTLDQVAWNNSRVVKGNIAEEIALLKQQPGKDILMFGGAGIASMFMKRGLIDDYRIHVHPIVLGGGIPLFKDVTDKINLKLLNTKTFKSGVVGVHYQKA
jgi:dihydrofolate reductase